MKYSERSFRRVLALVRIALGLVYVCYGYEKLFDTEFFRTGFMQRLTYWQDAAASWYAPVWRMLAEHPSRWDVVFGGVEMFIGVALVLGLATRAACLVGVLYTLHRVLLSWYPEGTTYTYWHFLELHFEHVILLSLFWLMMAGHAGDVWGLGAIHHRVKVRWRPVRSRAAAYTYFESDAEDLPEAQPNEDDQLQRGA